MPEGRKTVSQEPASETMRQESLDMATKKAKKSTKAKKGAKKRAKRK
jgi:hypothetical protein